MNACLYCNAKNKNKKIFCSVPVKIKIVCGRYATVRPSARPSPSPPPRFVGHADCPRHAARGQAAHCASIQYCANIHTVQTYILYAHPSLYKPTRQAGLWVIVGYCFLMTHNDPRGKKAKQQKARRVVCGSLWVMWAVILNRWRSRVLHRKCNTFFKLRIKISITHNDPQTAQTRMLISFERGSLAPRQIAHA